MSTLETHDFTSARSFQSSNIKKDRTLLYARNGFARLRGILRSLDMPKLANGVEADLSVKSAQGDVLIPVTMAAAMGELQKAILGTQSTSKNSNEDGFVVVNDEPRRKRNVKTITIKY